MALGQTNYYETNTNGVKGYQALADAGNTPQGYTPISGDQYGAGLQKMLAANPNNTTPGNIYNTADIQKQLSDFQSKSGIHAPGYLDPTLGKFQGNTPSEANFKPGQNPDDANKAAVAAGTMKTVQLPGGGTGYVPIGTADPNAPQNQTAGGASVTSPAEAAFNATQASGKTAPQSGGEVGTQVTDAIKQATPPNPAATTTPNVEAFYNTNKTMAQNTQDLMDLFSPPAVTQQLNDQLAKITTDQATLAGLNTQAMNIDNVMKGTVDDLSKEIQAAGGIVTESKIQALAIARNKTLQQQATLLQQKISTAQQAINNDTTLFQNEKDMANTQFSQRTAAYKMLQDNYNNMITAQKDSANAIISAIGYKGYLDGLQAQGPIAVANAEKALGLGTGGLQNLVTQQQQQQNANAIANSGATTPFVNKNGEIQSQTGYAYTSEQDFFNKTGMTIQQAESQGMVSMFKPSLDIQAKQADVALKNAQVSEVPLDIAAKKANIAQSNASAANSYASAAKTRLETQQLAQGGSSDAVQQKLEQQYRAVLVKEVNSRSGSLGTEDAKVVQANHLASLLNQYYDPKTGAYNVPKAQYGELVLGLAGMLSKTGTPTDNQVNNINTATAKGDLNAALTYVTGSPTNGSTQAVIKNLADSISRQANTAISNRTYAVGLLKGLAPTDLDPSRRIALEQNTLAPYSGIKGVDNLNQSGGIGPLNIGSSGMIPGSSINFKILP